MFGILLSQRPRRGVARVRCARLPLCDQALVELAKPGQRHVHLAAHLEHRRRAFVLHLEGYCTDRAEVRRDILALHAVAAGCAAREETVLIEEVDRGAVDLRLEHEHDGLVGPETLPDVVRPLCERLVGRHLLERSHRQQVTYLLELRGRRRSDALRRRVGRDELRVLRFERDEFVIERVVRRVRHDGVVLEVVRDQRAVQEVAQLCHAGTRLRDAQAIPRRSRRSRPAPRVPAARGRGCAPR